MFFEIAFLFVTLAGLELRYPPASTSQMLRLKVCFTTKLQDFYVLNMYSTRMNLAYLKRRNIKITHSLEHFPVSRNMVSYCPGILEPWEGMQGVWWKYLDDRPSAGPPKCSSFGLGENRPPGSGLSGHAAQRRGTSVTQTLNQREKVILPPRNSLSRGCLPCCQEE